MHILALGWIYVVSMMAITEPTVTAGLMTFFIYCVLPLGLLLALTHKKRTAGRSAKAKKLTEPNAQLNVQSQQDSSKN